MFEPLFSESSYGFRPGRSAHDAVRAARGYVLEGKTWMVDIDVRAFFDHVNHDRLVHQLREQIGDPRVLSLIGRYLRAGLLRHGEIEVRLDGTPQGGPLTPPTKLQTPAYNGASGSREPVSRGAFRGRCKPRSGWSLTTPRRGRPSDEATTAADVGAHCL